MAILKLRRGTSIPSLAESELFYHTSLDTLVVGDGTNSHILLKSGSNTVNLVDISGTISASYIHVSNDLTIHGNLYLGNQDTDNIVISAELSSSLIPDVDNTFDVGSSSKKWRHLYATSASIDELVVNGSGIVSSSQQISNYNTFLEIDGMGVFSGSEQVNANTITNFDSNVKDKMNSDGVLSGSAQLTTEFDTRYLNTNGDSVISSSAQLTTEFDTRYLNTDGDSVISSSAQLTTEFDTRYLNTNGDGVISSSAQLDSVFLEINGDNVFSSSQQVNANDITNFDSNVKDKMNSDGVISGSEQLESVFLEIDGDGVISQSQQVVIGDVNGFTTYSSSVDNQLDSIHSYTSSLKTAISVTSDDVTILGNLTVQGTETTLNTNQLIVEDKLISVASGSTTSAQADGAGLHISGANKSITWDDTNSKILIDSAVSSSEGFYGDGSNLTGITADSVTWNNITNKPAGIVSGSTQITDGSGIVSSSAQIIASLPDGVVSGSEQIDVTATTNYSSINQYSDTKVKTKLNIEGVLSGSQQVLDALPNGVVSGSTQITDGSGIVSQSAQITFGDISSIPSGLVSGSSQITDGSGIISSSTFSSPNQGTVRATINGTQTDVDTGLQSADSPSFAGLTLTGTSLAESTEYTALFLTSSDNSITRRELATAAFYNVSSSIDDGNPNVLGSAGAVKNYVDGKIIAAAAGDITAVIPVTGGGLAGGGYVGDVSMSIDTGSAHFTEGVTKGLPDGLVSQSAQITFGDISSVPSGLVSQSAQIDVTATANYSSINQYSNTKVLDYINDLGVQSGSDSIDYTDSDTLAYINSLGVISGSEQVNANTITNFDTNVVDAINDENVHSGSYLGTATTTNLTEGTNLYYTNTRVTNQVNDLGLVSQSAQIDVTATANYSSINQYSDTKVKTKLNVEGVISGSSQITDGSGLVSQSAQIDGTSILNNTITIAGTSTALGGSITYATITDGTGTISGSAQLTTEFDTRYLNTNSDGAVTSSQQVIDLLPSGVISGSSFSSPSQGTVRATINGSSTDVDTGLQSGDSPTFTNLTLTGNLTVQGTETILNTAELVVEDKLISVASGSTTSAEANGAGLHISGANESLTWDHANSRFNFSDDLHVVGQITATDDVVAYASSDRELKDNIQPIANPLEKINKISGNSFVWNEEKQNIYKGKDYGVIAQEIEKVLPELVQTRENGYKAVKYDKIVSLLIEGIKELSKEVTELKKNIRESN